MGIATIQKEKVDEILKKRDLKIVLLDCFYASVSDPVAQSLFSKIIELKVLGYQKEYGFGVMPIDTADFIATHILLCEEKNGELFPLMGFKSTTLSRAKMFNITFPAYNLLNDGENLQDHKKALKKLVTEAENAGEEIAYNASWTIHPSARGDKELKEFCRDLAMFFLIRYYDYYNIQLVIAAAVLRYKVEAQKEFVGFKFLSSEEKKLAPIKCSIVFGEEVSVMYMKGPSSNAKMWAHLFDRLWDQRIVIPAKKAEQEEKIAA